MSSDVTVAQVGGLTFFGTEPAEGFAIVRFTGWNDGPPARGEKIERPASHGDFDTSVTRGARLITMSGWCRAGSMEKLGHYRNRLMGVLADGQRDQFTVQEFGESRWASVRLYGDPTFERRGKSRYADWSLKLRAVDPRKYGKVNEFPAGSPTIHRGNVPAWPTFVVSGASAGGYTITGPGGQRIVVTTPLVAGVPHTVDTAEGEVMAGSSLGNISVFEPWTIGPGLPGVTHTISAGTLLVKVPDAFI